MAIRLEKGQRINLTKDSGERLTHFCVGCNWGAIEKRGFLGIRSTKDVDLDLSCLLLGANGNRVDHIYSPLYRRELLARTGCLPGKLFTDDGALRHTGDDLQGDKGGDDGLDNEIITVNLTRVSPSVEQIFFFLNNCGSEDFSQIPYAAIRMYEGTPRHVQRIFAAYDVAAEPRFAGSRALIMGKLYRRNGEWRFAAIGDPTPDAFVGETVQRILRNYV